MLNTFFVSLPLKAEESMHMTLSTTLKPDATVLQSYSRLDIMKRRLNYKSVGVIESCQTDVKRPQSLIFKAHAVRW